MKIKKLLLPTLLSIATMPIQAADLPNITNSCNWRDNCR